MMTSEFGFVVRFFILKLAWLLSLLPRPVTSSAHPHLYKYRCGNAERLRIMIPQVRKSLRKLLEVVYAPSDTFRAPFG